MKNLHSEYPSKYPQVPYHSMSICRTLALLLCAPMLTSCSNSISITTVKRYKRNMENSSSKHTSQIYGDKKYYGSYKIGRPYEIDRKTYYPEEDENYQEKGVASWYGDDFHNRKTANGDIFDMNRLTAAHRTLPMPSVVEVKNLDNGKVVVLVVNDRGPFVKDRIIDVSRRAAEELGFLNVGTARVRVKFLKRETEKLLKQLGLR